MWEGVACRLEKSSEVEALPDARVPCRRRRDRGHDRWEEARGRRRGHLAAAAVLPGAPRVRCGPAGRCLNPYVSLSCATSLQASYAHVLRAALRSLAREDKTPGSTLAEPSMAQAGCTGRRNARIPEIAATIALTVPGDPGAKQKLFHVCTVEFSRPFRDCARGWQGHGGIKDWTNPRSFDGFLFLFTFGLAGRFGVFPNIRVVRTGFGLNSILGPQPRVRQTASGCCRPCCLFPCPSSSICIPDDSVHFG